jgi:hypothetical protein
VELNVEVRSYSSSHDGGGQGAVYIAQMTLDEKSRKFRKNPSDQKRLQGQSAYLDLGGPVERRGKKDLGNVFSLLCHFSKKNKKNRKLTNCASSSLLRSWVVVG